MRFFLDSNVLVSGIVFPGTERGILRATFRAGHDFVISEDVRREVLKTLREKFPRFQEEAEEVLSVLRLETVPEKAYAKEPRTFPGLRDSKDAHILAAAIHSRCDAIVTGDRDLVVLGEVEGVRILRPRQARMVIGTTP